MIYILLFAILMCVLWIIQVRRGYGPYAAWRMLAVLVGGLFALAVALAVLAIVIVIIVAIFDSKAGETALGWGIGIVLIATIMGLLDKSKKQDLP